MSKDAIKYRIKYLCDADEVIDNLYYHVINKIRENKEKLKKRGLDSSWKIETEDLNNDSYYITIKLSFWKI